MSISKAFLYVKLVVIVSTFGLFSGCKKSPDMQSPEFFGDLVRQASRANKFDEFISSNVSENDSKYISVKLMEIESTANFRQNPDCEEYDYCVLFDYISKDDGHERLMGISFVCANKTWRIAGIYEFVDFEQEKKWRLEKKAAEPIEAEEKRIKASESESTQEIKNQGVTH